MQNEDSVTNSHNRAKAPRWMALVVFLLFLIWGWFYLFVLRIELNNWLAKFISGYPAVLHLFPLLAVPVGVVILLSKLFSGKQKS